MVENGYEFFEHTADVGARLWGQTLAQLFLEAAKSVTELVVADSPVAATEARQVTLSAVSPAELLRVWLNEVLVWFAADGFLVADGQLEAGETTLTGQVVGERFDPKRHAQGTEVKGVPYHLLRVEHTSHGWQATVLFDV